MPGCRARGCGRVRPGRFRFAWSARPRAAGSLSPVRRPGPHAGAGAGGAEVAQGAVEVKSAKPLGSWRPKEPCSKMP
ncbi:hypothetical protein Shyd_36230 [Streptomyces hydrogenans]|uniref:Uncharacterized protein n=1 Tax=Streptomyces hydrogenans TaxID=1873719 RepID=A0ABQ3PB43_9ACTN|nr:hypothetical protein GCM10018784_21540 [Streptomyces hydrogenans]GHI22252.1 hypothetical protein Shyd_36230 [Streptomyces hydrogenans]